MIPTPSPESASAAAAPRWSKCLIALDIRIKILNKKRCKVTVLV